MATLVINPRVTTIVLVMASANLLVFASVMKTGAQLIVLSIKVSSPVFAMEIAHCVPLIVL